MPPKKRTSDVADPSAQSGPGSNKKSRSSTANAAEPQPEPAPSKAKETATKTDEHADKLPFDYYCVSRPFWDAEAENFASEEALDEDELEEKYDAETSNDMPDGKFRLAVDRPDHPWVVMWSAWNICHDMRQQAKWCCPDLFGVRKPNDWHGYGMQAIIENALLAFDKEFKVKARDARNLHTMWSTIAGLAHYLLSEDLGPWIGQDDGERFNDTVDMIGKAVLTALDCLRRNSDLLRPQSPLKDLTLVMSMYLLWSDDLSDYGVEAHNLDWRKEVVAYAMAGGIDLGTSPCFGAGKVKAKIEEKEGKVAAIPSGGSVDRWDWKMDFVDFKGNHGRPKIGGNKYDLRPAKLRG